MNDMALDYAQHRFTVDEYHRMADAGVFPPDAHIELVDGEVVERLASMKPPHASAVAALDETIRTVIGNRAHLRCQLPVTLGDFSEPEPDFAIVRNPRSLYTARHPENRDVFALIEVSDTTRDFDLRRKVPVYAATEIPEVWIVDIVDSCIRIYRDPFEGRYRDVMIRNRGERATLLAFPETSIGVADIFE